MAYSEWQQEVLGNQQASLGNQETMIRQNDMGNFINAVGFYTVGKKLEGVNKSVGEVNHSVGEVRDAIQEMQQRTGLQLMAANATMNRVERAITHFGEIATHQRYAQWRGSTDEGRSFHYEYVPEARAVLGDYARLTTVWTDTVLWTAKKEIAAFPEWKKDEWKTDALTTGVYFDRPETPPAPTPPPRLEELKQPLPLPNLERSDIPYTVMMTLLYAQLATLILGPPVAIVVMICVRIGGERFGLIVGLLIGALCLATIALLNIRRRNSKNAKIAEIAEENDRRQNFVNGFYSYVEGWREHCGTLASNWERANSDAKNEAYQMLNDRVGVDLSTDFTEVWISDADRVRVQAIAATLETAEQRLPAFDERAPLIKLTFRRGIAPRYGETMVSRHRSISSPEQ